MIFLTYLFYASILIGIFSAGFIICYFVVYFFGKKISKIDSGFSVYESEVTDVLTKGAPAIKTDSFEKKNFAFVKCNQGRQGVGKIFEYKGQMDCASLYATYRGDLGCPWACLGLGDCAKVCEINAIIFDNGLARIGRNCTGCGKCIEVCPVGVIDLIPAGADFLIPCNSHGGKNTSVVCKKGCTGCGQCEISAAHAGYSVVDNLAKINYNRIGSRSIGMDVCPTKTIIKKEDFFNSFVEKKGFWSILVWIETFFKNEK